jgi:hypothetical protein
MKMPQDSEKKPALTLNDPVDPADLQRLAELQGRRFELADALLDLEQEKVKILVQARQLDDQKTQLFTRIVTDRGLPPGFPVEIDAKTGLVKPLADPDQNGAVQAPVQAQPQPS